MKCQKIIDSGAMCSRDALPGSKFCWQHQDAKIVENDTLTSKQKAFCEEYLIDMNATQAAIRAGYSEDTAYSIGQENLKKPEIQIEINRLRGARSKRTEITADRVLKELALLGYSNIKDYLDIVEKDIVIGKEKDEEGNEIPIIRKCKVVEVKATDEMDPKAVRAISEIKQTKYGITVKLYDKPKALENIGRHLGMWKDKIEITEGEKLEDYFD